jgi:hypothetical protein
MRDLYYRRAFGISADEFDAILDAQGGGCAICGLCPERLASLHLDHELRGWPRSQASLGCGSSLALPSPPARTFCMNRVQRLKPSGGGVMPTR